jgi:hypothetical protein
METRSMRLAAVVKRVPAKGGGGSAASVPIRLDSNSCRPGYLALGLVQEFPTGNCCTRRSLYLKALALDPQQLRRLIPPPPPRQSPPTPHPPPLFTLSFFLAETVRTQREAVLMGQVCSFWNRLSPNSSRTHANNLLASMARITHAIRMLENIAWPSRRDPLTQDLCIEEAL